MRVRRGPSVVHVAFMKLKRWEGVKIGPVVTLFWGGVTDMGREVSKTVKKKTVKSGPLWMAPYFWNNFYLKQD